MIGDVSLLNHKYVLVFQGLRYLHEMLLRGFSHLLPRKVFFVIFRVVAVYLMFSARNFIIASIPTRNSDCCSTTYYFKYFIFSFGRLFITFKIKHYRQSISHIYNFSFLYSRLPIGHV